MTARRLLALAAPLTTPLAISLAVAGLVAGITAAPASARTVDERCAQDDAPIPLHSLDAAAGSGCALTGRTVTAGRVSVVVPPAGFSAAGDGVGRHGVVRGLTVTNTGSTVRAVREAAPPATTARPSAARASNPPACKDRTFHLEHHKWHSHLRYRINLQKMPERFHKKTVTKQIRAANVNMRKGRNTCHKHHLKTPTSRYLGHTRVKPNVSSNSSSVSCGHFNAKNVVGFGQLPGGLLGWTCYWYNTRSGRMVAADMKIDNGHYLTTHLPSSCTNKWDFEGTVTHEWGHAFGMAHTGNGHQNLTMQHLLAPCSTYARTLGLGDWLGMNKMYGHHH